jgi:hypothetical protein
MRICRVHQHEARRCTTEEICQARSSSKRATILLCTTHSELQGAPHRMISTLRINGRPHLSLHFWFHHHHRRLSTINQHPWKHIFMVYQLLEKGCSTPLFGSFPIKHWIRHVLTCFSHTTGFYSAATTTTISFTSPLFFFPSVPQYMIPLSSIGQERKETLLICFGSWLSVFISLSLSILFVLFCFYLGLGGS